MDWYLKVVKNYAGFSGRARRKEYWMFFLFNVVISVVLAVLGAVTGATTLFGAVSVLYFLALLIPGIAVTIRRLHDTGRSGWWILIGLVPLVGFIILIVFMVQDSQPGPNQYGPNPKGAGA
jgi:uncharacterized membrane protein YhaH (DUF805 family)